MTGSVSLQLGAIAAIYLLWFVSWLVLGPEIWGPEYYNWDQSLVATVAAVTAFNVSRRATKPYPVFLGHQLCTVCVRLGLCLGLSGP